MMMMSCSAFQIPNVYVTTIPSGSGINFFIIIFPYSAMQNTYIMVFSKNIVIRTFSYHFHDPNHDFSNSPEYPAYI